MKKQKFVSAREIKVETVGTLSEKIGRAKTIAFTDYRGLTVNQISELRNKVKDAGGEILVTKNSLIKRALRKNDLEATTAELEGPTATVFAYEDELAPIKVVADSTKTLTLPKFKFGFFGKDRLDVFGLEELAKIPGRNQLNAKFVGTIASPLFNFAYVLQANIRNLVSILDQVAKKGA